MTPSAPLAALDRLVLKVAGREGTLRQHATWITGMGINYVEEQALNEVAKMVESQRLLATDVERILWKWATSGGKKALRWFLVVIEKIAEEKKTHVANVRKATSNPSAELGDQKAFTDKQEAALFITYLKCQSVHGWISPSGTDKVVGGAPNIHELYKTFMSSRGDPRPPSQQPPDEGATARLACPDADASLYNPSPSQGEGQGEVDKGVRS
ncbi:MAG: hypothetical protein M1469_01120 [Bacteroidetes bacterium]|nr:hypothetical protein [Bacteroidota bacterium]